MARRLLRGSWTVRLLRVTSSLVAVIAREIIDNLAAALEQFRLIEAGLSENGQGVS
jgi:hypothetical protein